MKNFLIETSRSADIPALNYLLSWGVQGRVASENFDSRMMGVFCGRLNHCDPLGLTTISPVNTCRLKIYLTTFPRPKVISNNAKVDSSPLDAPFGALSPPFFVFFRNQDNFSRTKYRAGRCVHTIPASFVECLVTDETDVFACDNIKRPTYWDVRFSNFS